MQRTAEIGLDCNLFTHEVTFACQQGIFSPNLINSLDECLVFLSMVGLWYLCERFLDRWYLKRNLPYHKFPLQTVIIFFNNRSFPSKQNNSLTFLFPTIPRSYPLKGISHTKGPRGSFSSNVVVITNC